MARLTMDDDDRAAYRGGRVNAADDEPKRVRYPCFADGCPMAGTMFTTLGTSPGQKGSCPMHWQAAPVAIPAITQRLLDWGFVAREIDAARALLTGEYAASPRVHALHHGQAWARLLAQLSPEWAAVLRPLQAEDLGLWARRLERFLAECATEKGPQLPPAPQPVDVPEDAPRGVRWAYRVLQRKAAGEHVARATLAMARDVVETRERRAPPLAPLPDVADAHPSALEV